MDILLSGICGHMGKETAEAIRRDNTLRLVGGVDVFEQNNTDVPCFSSFDSVDLSADCVIDFSHHSVTEELLDFVCRKKLPLVLATTGQTEGEKASVISASAHIPLFFAPNCSMGIALIADFAKKAASAMKDAEIEIIDIHHSRKLDAPSGTALDIAEKIRKIRPRSSVVCGRSGKTRRCHDEIGIHSIRMGDVVGSHEILISTSSETLTLRHDAHSRTLFAEGAIAAAKFIINKPHGIYTMENMIKES